MGGFEIKIFSLEIVGFFWKVILEVVVDKGVSNVVVIVMYVVYVWRIFVRMLGEIL